MPEKIKIILNPTADMGNPWRVAHDLRSITEQHSGVEAGHRTSQECMRVDIDVRITRS